MNRTFTRALLAIAIVLGTLVDASPAAESHIANGTLSPRTIDSYGFWSLSRLGAGAIVFRDVEHTAKHSVPYRLEPRRAKQGPKDWYQIRLHARVTFGAGAGHAYLFAAQNGYTSALIEYDAFQSGRTIVRKTISYIDGSSRITLRSHDEVRFRNYLQYRGVRTGLNHLTFSVERNGSLQIKRVDILADSGIAYTRQGPARLVLDVNVPRQPLKKGVAYPLTVDLRNVGDQEIRAVAVNVGFAHADLHVKGSTTRNIGTLRKGVARHITFTFVPRRSGSILLVVGARGSGGNQPAVSKTLHVR